ncbi:hypothetical protein HanRHA438_Chr06g0282931 [Helianthus annuus]|nr:hypothetical protein HanRHA438_Chr06g0282931 [Helianthus annuus]
MGSIVCYGGRNGESMMRDRTSKRVIVFERYFSKIKLIKRIYAIK